MERRAVFGKKFHNELFVLANSQLCMLVDVYDARDVETYILPMAFHLADDRVAQIRHLTLRLVRSLPLCTAKMSPFYFLSNFIMPLCVFVIFGLQIAHVGLFRFERVDPML